MTVPNSLSPDYGTSAHLALAGARPRPSPPSVPGAAPDGTLLETWLGYAKINIPIVPEHAPDPTGPTGCDCRRPDCKKPGKHPRTKNGSLDATTNTATLGRWAQTWPRANTGTALEMSDLVIIGPDSPKWAEELVRRGLPPTAMVQSGGGEGHLHYYYRRRSCCPPARICKPGEYDLLAKGNAILPPSLHASGRRYTWLVPIESLEQLPEAPAWLCDELHPLAERRRALESRGGSEDDEPPILLDNYGRRVWRGELPKRHQNGEVERSGTLLKIGRALYDAGATRRLIVAELTERDATLGYRKYTDRPDASRQYHAIVDELERQGRTPRLIVAPPSPEGRANGRANGPADTPPESGHDGVDGCRSCTGKDAEIVRLQGRAIDRDERLEVLEEYIHAIDDVLGRPDDELSADDKVVAIAGARWLHTFRSKKIANGQPPTISLNYLAKVTGTPGRRVSKSLDRLSSVDPDDGAPFRKQVTRKPGADGEGWASTLEVIPWRERAVETFRAAATYATPARPKRGGSRAASDARWGRCPKHQEADIIVRGACSACGRVLGERCIGAEAFDALNVQVEHSDREPPRQWETFPSDVQLEHSDRKPRPLNLQVVDSAVINGHAHQDGNGAASGHEPAVATLPRGPAPVDYWRCPCTSYERHYRPSFGDYACDGCGMQAPSPEVRP